MEVNLNNIRAEKLRRKETKQIEEANKSLLMFIHLTKPDYDFEWFHKLIISKIQDLIDGKIKKLAVFMPPQHGKSEITTRRLPAYIMGAKPGTKVAISSYSAELSSEFARDIKMIIESPEYSKVFQASKTANKGSRLINNADIFELENHSKLKAVGVMGSLTGFTVDFGIIDDPVKDDMEATSKTYRDRVWNWYTKVFKTRLHNESKQLLIMTRWHVDDLAGRILASENDWEVINIPAICEKENEFENSPRKIGEVLYPKKHSLERILKIKELNPATFNSLYQQRPVIEGGNKIKVSYFKTIEESECPRLEWQMFVDGAYTENTKNDPTALMVCGSKDGNLYIKFSQSKHLELVEACTYIEQLYKDMECTLVNIEPKASGLSFKSTLQNRGVNTCSITGKIITLSKFDRVSLTENYVEAGRIILIRGPWNDQFKVECGEFPKGEHDDQVDCFAYAVNKFLRSNVVAY